MSRGACALASLGFIALALALASGGGSWSLLGLLVALTPMVYFISSVVNPNGLEIAASLTFVAGLLRLARYPLEDPGWPWVAVAVSGAVVVLSWQLGPVLAAVDLALAGAMLGRERLNRLLSEWGESVRATAVMLSHRSGGAGARRSTCGPHLRAALLR